MLNGNKTFITNGPYADTIVFICKLDEGNEKIKGLYNPADLGTKILQGDRVRALALSIGLGAPFLKVKGRPTAALQAGRRLQVTILAAPTLLSRGQEVSEAGLVVGEEALIPEASQVASSHWNAAVHGALPLATAPPALFLNENFFKTCI